MFFLYFSLMSFLGHVYIKKYLRNRVPSRQLLLRRNSHHLAMIRKLKVSYTSFLEWFLTSHPFKTGRAP